MISIVIPTYNAASYIGKLLRRLKEQTVPHELIIIDSESTDDTKELVSSERAKLISISKSEFNHGTTRNLGLKVASSSSDIVVFMTQDALPASEYTLEKLIAMLRSRKEIAMAYGRQIPYSETGILGQLARFVNYPPQSLIKTRAMIPKMGIKTCSCSNSFAAYYKSDLLAIGGFPTDTILGEDVSVGARFILDGKAIAYCAEAEVYHSHDYTVVEEFKRYFDIGVFHLEQQDVLSEFTRAETQGLKYVWEEWEYLRRNGHLELVPTQIIRTIVKYAGYRLGSLEQYLPVTLKRRISMHASFWK